MNSDFSTLAARLVQARRIAELQQDFVAKSVGMSQQSYSDLETGKSKSTVRIGSLAQVLGVDAYWLETGNGQMSRGVAESPARYTHPEFRRILAWMDSLSDRQRKGLIDLIDGADKAA